MKFSYRRHTLTPTPTPTCAHKRQTRSSLNKPCNHTRDTQRQAQRVRHARAAARGARGEPQEQRATATARLQVMQPGLTRLAACSPNGVPDLPVVSVPQPELAFGRAEDRLLAEELVRWLAVEDVRGERLGLVLLGQLLRSELCPLQVALLVRVKVRTGVRDRVGARLGWGSRTGPRTFAVVRASRSASSSSPSALAASTNSFITALWNAAGARLEECELVGRSFSVHCAPYCIHGSRFASGSPPHLNAQKAVEWEALEAVAGL